LKGIIKSDFTKKDKTKVSNAPTTKCPEKMVALNVSVNHTSLYSGYVLTLHFNNALVNVVRFRHKNTWSWLEK